MEAKTLVAKPLATEFGHQSLETKLATEISVAKSVAENLVTKIQKPN